MLYYVYNGETQRRHYEDIKETRTIRHGLPSRDIIVLTPYSIKGEYIMYVLTINGIVTVNDNEKDARKAFHESVAKNGLDNVKITKETL